MYNITILYLWKKIPNSKRRQWVIRNLSSVAYIQEILKYYFDKLIFCEISLGDVILIVFLEPTADKGERYSVDKSWFTSEQLLHSATDCAWVNKWNQKFFTVINYKVQLEFIGVSELFLVIVTYFLVWNCFDTPLSRWTLRLLLLHVSNIKDL